MTPSVLDRCTADSFSGTSFPDTLATLTREGVEWYSANLIIGMKTYYGGDLSRHSTPWPNWETPSIADQFSPDKVSAAIRASQAREIDYRTFLERIAEAGVTYYTVHLSGRKAIYFGRHGDFFGEPFPLGGVESRRDK
jgi:uncharacterized protein YbcV (DUF1398 family)